MIRECFPSSILLGSVDDPVQITEDCSPVSIEENSISACICTSDLCNGIEEEVLHANIQTQRNFSEKEKVIDEIDIAVIEELELIEESTSAPKFSKVICHQCGSLFSGKNPDCEIFDQDNKELEGFCEPGEACLWYSWQKTKEKTAYVRECFSKAILLGTLDNQLLPKETCEPQDISEGSQKVEACLCETDFCNSYRGPNETLPDPSTKKIKKPKLIPVLVTEETEDFLNAPKFKPSQIKSDSNRDVKEKTSKSNDKQDSKQLASNEEESSKKFVKPLIPDTNGLQCFSCGNLFNPEIKCEQFNRTDIRQVQTCLSDESCLLYEWKKSATESGTIIRIKSVFIHIYNFSHAKAMFPKTHPAWSNLRPPEKSP